MLPPEIESLFSSWRLSLRARRVKDSTVLTYHKALSQLTAHSEVTRVEAFTKAHVESYLLHMLTNYSSATAKQRFSSLRVFFKWLLEEGEIQENPMQRIKPPRVVEQPIKVLSDDQIRALLDACTGKSFEDLRDMAVVRVLVDTGMRVGELTGLTEEDIDLNLQVLIVTGKGDRIRAIPFGSKSALSIDKYRRARRSHPKAGESAFWLGPKGAFSSSGVQQMLARRGRAVGLPFRLHPHMLRHGFADAWLRSGRSEGDLLRIAGWKSRSMLSRYGAAMADDRAHQAYRQQPSPGDRF